jgi:hypothetical protein
LGGRRLVGSNAGFGSRNRWMGDRFLRVLRVLDEDAVVPLYGRRAGRSFFWSLP